MSDENKLSRRDFIKGAAAVSASVATAGLLTNAASAQTAPGVPAKWDKVVDVVVVGSGFGLAAAVEAKRAGADVLVVEKADHAGGLQIVGGDGMTMGGGTTVQLKAGETKDTVEQWFQDEMYTCEYRGVPEVLRALCARGPETVKWLQDLGIEFEPLGAGVLRPPIKRGHAPKASPGLPGGEPYPKDFPYGTRHDVGMALHSAWKRELVKLGVPILLKHRMTRLYRPDMNGPVVGIEAKTDAGIINIRAKKGVILCTGTWTDNDRMLQAWDPRIVGPDCYGDGGTPTDGYMFVDSAGDGHLAAAEIGAAFSDMSFAAYIYIFYGTRSYFGWDPLDWTKQNEQISIRNGLLSNAAQFQRVVLVKGDGARWINETLGGYVPPAGKGSYSENPENPYTATYLSLPQPRNVWAITDADGVAALKWPVADLQKPNPKICPMLDPTCVAIADSLQDLAAKMGIDPAKLQATITKFNGFVDAGKDADFGKPMPLFKLAKPPFYAVKASLIRHTQRNGLRVNTKSQVLAQADQKDGSGKVRKSIDDVAVIPHLYAAGEIGDAMGFRRAHNSVGHYITAARICGENAAKETPLPAA